MHAIFKVPTPQELKAAKAKAKNLWADLPGVTGFGLGQDCVVVYISNPEIRAQLDDSVAGVRVDTTITGPIRQQ